MILDEERWFAIPTWMVLLRRKFLMKLKMLFLIPCISRIYRIRYLHTISYAFSVSRHTVVSYGWLAKASCILVSRLIKWIVGGMELPKALEFGDQVTLQGTTVGDCLPLKGFEGRCVLLSTYLYFYLQFVLWRGCWKDVGFGWGEERLYVSSQNRCLDASVGLMAATYPRRLLFITTLTRLNGHPS